jgi:hypothetical protein
MEIRNSALLIESSEIEKGVGNEKNLSKIYQPFACMGEGFFLPVIHIEIGILKLAY